MNPITRLATHLLGLAAASLATAAPALALPACALTVLNGLDDAGSNIAFAINNVGAMVGATTTRDSDTQLFTRSACCRRRPLPTRPMSAASTTRAARSAPSRTRRWPTAQ
jgi:hypothetical protein